MPTRRARTALIYDFDGTLAQGNIQEHSFIPELGVKATTFWHEVDELARRHDADKIAVYLWHMLEVAKAKGVTITRASLKRHGRKTPLYAGLDTWFDRINRYGRTHQLALEHYVISSGNYELIAGCPIVQRFKNVFASRYLFDKKGNAVWPASVINYTTKTQFLFRINKGIENTWDDSKINRWIPLAERPIPFERIIFIGDGDTDIPSFKTVRNQGGYSVAVFDPIQWPTAKTQTHVERLIAEDRAHYAVPADYREGSQLAVTVKGIIGRIAREVGYRGDTE